jgi:ATP-dependent Clp protease ATP-binding subunit ClpA
MGSGMNETNEKTIFNKLLSELEQKRDELKLQAHFFKKGTKDEWEMLEKKWHHFKGSAHHVGHFRPEFINRLDEIVVFHPLKQDQVREIAKIQLNYLHRRLAEKDLLLDISDKVVDVIFEAGFDPVYGARPLKRVIKNKIEKEIAKRILGGEFRPGDTINIGIEDDVVTFHKTT